MQKAKPEPLPLCLLCQALQLIDNLYVLINQVTLMATADLRNAEDNLSRADAHLLLRNHPLRHLSTLTGASQFFELLRQIILCAHFHMPRLMWAFSGSRLHP